MPRRPARRIGASSQMTGGRASSSSEPSRVRTKISVSRSHSRGVHASSSTAGRQRPTASERRRKLQQDPLPEQVEEHVDSSSEDDSSEEEAQPSSPRASAPGEEHGDSSSEDDSSEEEAQPSSLPAGEPVEDDSHFEEGQPSSPPAAAAREGPIPGGPADLSVLMSFRTHVALSIWDGEVQLSFLIF